MSSTDSSAASNPVVEGPEPMSALRTTAEWLGVRKTSRKQRETPTGGRSSPDSPPEATASRLGERRMSAEHLTQRGLSRYLVRTGPSKLAEQDEETVLVLWRQVRPAPFGLKREVTNLAALIGRESLPILPTLRVQPSDRGEDSAPRDLPHSSDGLQDPRGHRCLCYPEPATSNGDGSHAWREDERNRPLPAIPPGLLPLSVEPFQKEIVRACAAPCIRRALGVRCRCKSMGPACVNTRPLAPGKTQRQPDARGRLSAPGASDEEENRCCEC